MSIEARDAWYIKLGRGGNWEREAVESGTLRLGYHAYPHALCVASRWAEVRAEVAGRQTRPRPPTT